MLSLPPSAAILLLLAPHLSESSRLFHPISITEPCLVVLPATESRPEITVSIEYALEDPESVPTFEHFLLSLRPTKAQGSSLRSSAISLESSYGKFQLFVVDLTGDGIEEVVCILGEGRGTSARSEYLHVYRWEGASINNILLVPFSEHFGMEGRWWYVPEFWRDAGTGRVSLDLRLEHDQFTGREDEFPDLIPKDNLLVYQWDEARQRLVRVQ